MIFSPKNKKEPFSAVVREVNEISGQARDQWKVNSFTREDCFKEWGLDICKCISGKMPDFKTKIWLVQEMIKSLSRPT
jgi:hypothetical protein